MQKKKRLKKWVLYSLYIIALFIFFIVGIQTGVIKAYKNVIDITNIVIIIIAWECLRKSLKACYNREKSER